EKMSKSLGNVISPLDIADTFGADPLRYFLLREVVYGQDGDFTYDRFVERYNSDLANDLGNLVNRTVTMIDRYLGGNIPEEASLPDDAVSYLFPDILHRWTTAIERYDLSNACDIAWELIRIANRRVEESAPWKLAKDPNKRDKLVGVLLDLASVIGSVAVLLYPYIPSSSASIWESLGFPAQVTDAKLNELHSVPFIPRGIKIGKVQVLFPRIELMPEEKKVTVDQNQAVSDSKESSEKVTISIQDFAKLDLRIGKVINAERMEGSKKLLRLDIDDGMGGRRIIAGLAQHFTPDDIKGKQVVFIANLEPRKMMDEYSQGMVLAAEDNGKLSVLTLENEVSPGSKVS
ncbi:MAG TPA: methionine--tRNA ligase subunit beta, partial [Anaerolineae bacterium]|nr:methionine--tRNA ligase subunit beta [Anaerolineae bacterium]